MNYFETFKQTIGDALRVLEQEGKLPQNLDMGRLTCEPPRERGHGDMATNAAMILSKQAGLPPREIAQLLKEKLSLRPEVSSVEVAGPGFINIRLKPSFWFDRLQEILQEGTAYGTSDVGRGSIVNVEYVSTNPTGPIHVGHCRGAIFGDVLASLLEKVGYEVVREYYVNDAGTQVNTLAESVYQRYLQALGHEIGPIEGYPGEYLIPVGEAIAKTEGDRWVSASLEERLPFFRTQAVTAMMDLIREDLALLGVHQTVFTSENEIVQRGEVEEALKVLEVQGLLYEGVLDPPKGKKIEDWEPREQLLFKSTAFGDDVDRPLRKSDGTWTYFTPDIAYHYDKYKRGANIMINVLGADHAGYVKRLTSAVKAVSQGKAEADIKICQLVRYMENGVAMKMSKRAGTFISVQEAVEKVGKDALRFIMLTRKNDAPLDFDFAKVVEKTKDNPVFYVQYAHARIHSVKRQLAKVFPDVDPNAINYDAIDPQHISSEPEIELIKLLAQWPRQVEVAALAHEPHRLAFYLYDLASAFHALWNLGKDQATLRFIHEDDKKKTEAKLALIQAVANVLASGLTIFGVTAVEEM